MGAKAVLLIEGPPKFTAKGGLFYVDCGVAAVPILAFTAHDMLKAIAKAGERYDEWARNGGEVNKIGH